MWVILISIFTCFSIFYVCTMTIYLYIKKEIGSFSFTHRLAVFKTYGSFLQNKVRLRDLK